jgi:hypothetical protein
MLWAKLRFRRVDARLSRVLEEGTMPKLALCSLKPLLCLPLAVFGIMLLCLPLEYARLRLRLATWIGRTWGEGEADGQGVGQGWRRNGEAKKRSGLAQKAANWVARTARPFQAPKARYLQQQQL